MVLDVHICDSLDGSARNCGNISVFGCPSYC